MKEGRIEFLLRGGEIRAFTSDAKGDEMFVGGRNEYRGDALVIALQKRDDDIQVEVREIPVVQRLSDLHDAVLDGTVSALIAERDQLRQRLETKPLAQIALIAHDFAKGAVVAALPEGSHNVVVQGPVRAWNMLVTALDDMGLKVPALLLAEPDQRPWAPAGSPLDWAKLAIGALERPAPMAALSALFSTAMNGAYRLGSADAKRGDHDGK